MGPIYTFDDVIDMLRRRSRAIIMVILLGSIASVISALSAPHVYQSSEVIQIKLPKVSNDLAPSTVEGSPMRRLLLIEQQLMARGNIIDVIKKHDLYNDMPALRMSDKVELLRGSITITGAGSTGEGYENDGILSTLSFTARMNDPADAQAVARDFADRTRSLSIAQRREQTLGTLEFLQRQEENLIRDIATLEAERADFQAANDLALEGSLLFRQSEIGNLNEAILTLDREIVATRLARTRVSPNAREATIARRQAELDATLENLSTQRDQLVERRDALNSSLQTSPEVDRELARFERRLEQLQNQLVITTGRRSAANVGASLEIDKRSEELITLEAAELPEYPITSSRTIIAAIGGVGSVALSLIVAFVLEIRHPVLRTAQQITRETGITPLISIPDISAPEKANVWKQAWEKRSKAGLKGRASRRAHKKARPS
ncbi:DUF874 domain-containing protein [Sulfitobacter sp. S0837]|uniref:DUF874 domain-containing protein n=1 Tax=Sulfitobacter maritimus TaxID=2741719 RepID=UPI001581BC08|nr:DUF874 domain-containing protein [Sulfitobacter maritimus]NUH63721.1 DUF874 domain-containing protein [Sulfitobacter maritimus]NUH63805.1 DUF874 domain-containing protein [Sulfitobacter maritimus]NUH65568.1 DUF874 domain-containing protein [Sulfitobacter maritimus]